jgi:hypothetical protein
MGDPKFKRPEVLDGNTIQVKTKCGMMYVTMTHDDNNVLTEVFITTGSIGDQDKTINMNPCCKHFCEIVGKQFTHHIRNKLELKRIIKQTESTTECMVGYCKYPDGRSCGNAIAYALKKYMKENEEEKKEEKC